MQRISAAVSAQRLVTNLIRSCPLAAGVFSLSGETTLNTSRGWKVGLKLVFGFNVQKCPR